MMDRVVIENCRAELQSQLDELLAGAERTVVDMTSVEEENFPDPTASSWPRSRKP